MKLAKILSAFVLTFAVAMLVACAPSNSEKAVEKMKKAGFTAAATTYSEVQEDGAVAVVSGTKDSLSQALSGMYTATLYKTAKQAKAAYNETKDAEGKTNCTLVGKWVVWGSEEAVKAFKK